MNTKRFPFPVIPAALLLAILLLPVAVLAATGTINLSWVAPTLAIDGTALTGSQALTKYQVFISTSAIPDNATTPTVEITAPAGTTVQTLNVAPGDVIQARMKACNSAGCSALTAAVTKAVPVSVPGLPTSVTISITIG